ncbi:hypothetical protein D8770_27535 [Methylobacterium sp. DB1607]|nr:hypothetical protein [Methylobacterium sp. DB1607]
MTPPDASRPADDFREFIAEIVARAAVYAQHAESYARLGDDAGLQRSVRLMTTCAVKAAETLPMLAEAARGDRAIRDAARAVAASSRPAPAPPAREPADG